ncbi:hypothetical protein IBX38_06105 [Candidatus Bathyarchaeota archaeon]|nr:hypothetical protein [Candidatus Bathyarchaeota archaeon]
MNIALDEEGLVFLGGIWYKALERGRFREVEYWAHVLYEYGVYKRTNFVSLSRLKRALLPLKIDVNALEPYVVKLRALGQRSAKIVEIKSMPLDLRNVYAAAIMGYVGDAKIDDYTLLIGQKECFKDFETCVYEAFGKIRISNYDAGSIEHHHVSKLLSYVLSVAGYHVSKRQTLADNPAPLWFFIMDDSFKGAYLKGKNHIEMSFPINH